MHIVHILFTLSTGGMESMLMDIISEQSNYERVSLIIINRENNYKILDFLNKDIPVYIVNRPKGSNNPYWVFKLNSILFRLKANIVHIHNGNTIKLLFKNPRTRYVYTEHDTKLGIKNPKKFDQIYAISKSVKNKLYETFRYNASLVYNGIKTESIFSNAQERKSKIFNLVQISRLETQKKGQHILIQAINELVNNRGINNIHVDFIGDGESLNELIQLCEKYNLSKYISFKGAVNRTDIYKNLHNYQLLVQPSISDTSTGTPAAIASATVRPKPS